MIAFNVRIVLPDTAKHTVPDSRTPSGRRVVETPYTAEALCKLLYDRIQDVVGAAPLILTADGDVRVDMDRGEYAGTRDIREVLSDPRSSDD